MKSTITTIFLVISTLIFGQVPITTGSYSQNFNTNYPWLGWSPTSFGLNQNIQNSVIPINDGGIYTYSCNGSTDRKIGTRPSNSVGPANIGFIEYGVLFQNQINSDLFSIRVSYTGYQLSLADNGNVTNRIDFQYQVSSSSISLSSTSWIDIDLLDYIAPNNSPTNSNNSQLSSYPCTVFQNLSYCFPIFIQDGEYLFLKWKDMNNSNNDPHLAIDDLFVEFGLVNNDCSIILPVELIRFDVSREFNYNLLNWSTASESNNSHFEIERSQDGFEFKSVGRVQGSGNSNSILSYEFRDYDNLNGSVYYRLNQVDIDGQYTYSNIVVVNTNNDLIVSNGIISYRGKEIAEIYDISGKLIHSLNGSSFSVLDRGVLAIRIGDKTYKKIFLN